MKNGEMGFGLAATAALVTVTLALAMGILTGCANEPQIPEDTEPVIEYESEEPVGLDKFVNADRWEDSWELTFANDTKGKIKVNADIDIPQTELMYRMRVKEPAYGEPFYREFTGKIFGDSVLYYYDIPHLPKTDLGEKIERYRMNMESLYGIIDPETEKGQTGNAPNDAFYEAAFSYAKEQKTMCESYLYDAGDSYIPAEDYGADAYLGKRGDIDYILEMKEEQCWNEGATIWRRKKTISLRPVSLNDVCPQTMRQAEDLILEELPMEYAQENHCMYSLEQARAVAEDFLAQLGILNQTCVGAETLSWMGDCMQVDESTWQYNAMEDFGYVFTFRTEINGITLRDCGTEFMFSNMSYTDIARDTPVYSMDDRITVQVTDEGVIGMEMCNPILVEEMTPCSDFLSLAKAKDAIRQETLANADSLHFYGTNAVGMNRMELTYVRIKDLDEEGMYDYVPAWRLSKSVGNGMMENPVFIDAINGSFIDYWKAW